jgi:adenylyl-sulfate kinase
MSHSPAFTVWLTGLPQSGKSTLGEALARRLRDRYGLSNTELLDGDIVRADLSQDLGFSREDRDENIRRIAFVAKVLTRAGVPNIVAAVSPYREARARARADVAHFVEVHLDAPAEVCEARDHKGNWARARAGEITGFTGVDDPYEAPEDPELRVDTAGPSVDEGVDRIVAFLEAKGYVARGLRSEAYSADEEAEVAARLESLGYM